MLCHGRDIPARFICVAIVKYRTKLKVLWRGVCTSYLSGLVIATVITHCMVQDRKDELQLKIPT